MFVKIPRYIYIHTINKPYEFELIFIFIKIFPKNVGDVRFFSNSRIHHIVNKYT